MKEGVKVDIFQNVQTSRLRELPGLMVVILILFRWIATKVPKLFIRASALSCAGPTIIWV